MWNRQRVASLLLAALLLMPGQADTPGPKSGPARLRRPVALVLADGGRRLFVANRCGSVSVIDTENNAAIAECDVGRTLASLGLLPDGRLLATDEETNELLLLSHDAAGVKVAHRLKVSPTPVSVRVAADGTRCFVASLW